MQKEGSQIIKMLLYVAIMLVLYVLQTANGFPMHIMGIKIDLLPCVLMSVALLDGPVEGMIIGLVAGILQDVSYNGAEGLLPLYFMVCGVAAGMLGQRYLRRIWPSQAMLSASTVLLMSVMRYAFSWLMQTPLPLLKFTRLVCGNVLIMITLSPLIYFLVRKISRRYQDKETD